MKNIGFTKKEALLHAKYLNDAPKENKFHAYVQKEEHFWSGGTYQWIVILQKAEAKHGGNAYKEAKRLNKTIRALKGKP